jgi:hypothetical protein
MFKLIKRAVLVLSVAALGVAAYAVPAAAVIHDMLPRP